MCSVFGFIARSKNPIPVAVLERMARANIQRGPHAFGFSWVTRRGRIHHYKQAGNLVNHLDAFSMIGADAVAVIGHVRWATHGRPEDNINNHPHACDGGWMIHNGVVHNYEDLVLQTAMPIVSNCDSEAIAILIERAKGSPLNRTVEAMGGVQGKNNILCLWSRPLRLIVARNGNPLSVGTRDDGKFFSTLADGLPPCCKVATFGDQTAAEYTLSEDTKGVLGVKVRTIKPFGNSHISGNAGGTSRPVSGGGLFTNRQADGEYRGG